MGVGGVSWNGVVCSGMWGGHNGYFVVALWLWLWLVVVVVVAVVVVEVAAELCWWWRRSGVATCVCTCARAFCAGCCAFCEGVATTENNCNNSAEHIPKDNST